VELYWLLTGSLPFQGREGELVHAILHQEHPTEDTRVKTARKTPDTQQVKPQSEETGSRVGKAGALAVCTLIGCTGSTAGSSVAAVGFPRRMAVHDERRPT
jgi:hypothetical protein